jgi:hypothetical protein
MRASYDFWSGYPQANRLGSLLTFGHRLTLPGKAGPFRPEAVAGTGETDWLPEESGFELTVPSDRSVSNQGRQPLCNARRFGAGTGTETSKGK